MAEFIDKVSLFWSKTNRWHRLLFILLMVELKLVPSRQYGFHCNDPALSFPFTGDTITWKWLMAVCILLPFVIMLITERMYHGEDKQRPQKRALRWYKEYLFGFLVNLDIVQILKTAVGSPRPHFFDTCKPVEATTCVGSEFISSYTCTGAGWLNQSDRSFPSGHTSLAIHAALFIAYYLHVRTGSKTSSVRGVQTCFVSAGILCSLSRLTDHRHHWWDVLAGAAIGIATLVYTIQYPCRNFVCAGTKPKTADENGAKFNVTKVLDKLSSDT